MPKLYPVWQSFASGELSPFLLARSDLEIYDSGLYRCRNFIPKSHGPISRRRGTAYRGKVKGQFGRIFGFKYTQEQSFFVIATDEGKMYVADNDGTLIDISDEEVSNGDFIDRGTDWADTSTGAGVSLFFDGFATIIPGEEDAAGFEQQVTGLTASTDYTLSITTINNSLDALPELTVKVGTTQGGTEISSTNHVEGRVSVEFNTGAATAVWITLEVAAGEGRRDVRKVSLFKSSVTQKEISTSYDRSDVEDMQVAMSPSGLTMYLVTPNVQPYKLVFNPAARTWTFSAVSFTATPSEWGAGNYPRAITFFQGRMWIGGTFDEPSTFWASKSADYENFTQGANDADSIEFTLSTGGRIAWLIGSKNLLVGTDVGEHIVTSDAGVITPGDKQVLQQSAFGSSPIMPEQLANQVLYVSPDGRKVREMGYQWTDEGWVSRDISFQSEHLTEGDRITEIVFAQHPGNLILCATEDGNLLSCTYERTYGVIGWAKHTSGESVASVATSQFFGVSLVGLIANRGFIDDSDQAWLYYELFDENYHADSSYEKVATSATTTWTGLDHIAGDTVSLLVWIEDEFGDGQYAVHPEVTVSADGVLYTDYETTKIVAGLPYTATAQTLPVDYADQVGRSHAYQKRWNKIYARVLGSSRPIINGARPAVRSPVTSMGVPEPFKTEDISVANVGHDMWGVVTIEENMPVPCTILGIFGEMNREVL